MKRKSFFKYLLSLATVPIVADFVRAAGLNNEKYVLKAEGFPAISYVRKVESIDNTTYKLLISGAEINANDLIIIGITKMRMYVQNATKPIHQTQTITIMHTCKSECISPRLMDIIIIAARTFRDK